MDSRPRIREDKLEDCGNDDHEISASRIRNRIQTTKAANMHARCAVTSRRRMKVADRQQDRTRDQLAGLASLLLLLLELLINLSIQVCRLRFRRCRRRTAKPPSEFFRQPLQLLEAGRPFANADPRLLCQQ